MKRPATGRHDARATGMMMPVDWTPLLSTIAGAVIAFSGTVAADHLRRRDSRHRYSYGERQRAYTESVLALGAGMEALRAAGVASRADRRRDAADAALTAAGVYVARERLLMVAVTPVAEAAEAAFTALIRVRDAVRAGATTGSAEFHGAFHPFEDALWQLRERIRDDLGAPPLRLDRTRCEVCVPA
jgi:hypothetical protein